MLQSHFVAKNDLKLLMFLALSPKGWLGRCTIMPLWPVYVVLRIEARAACLLDEYSTTQDIPSRVFV